MTAELLDTMEDVKFLGELDGAANKEAQYYAIWLYMRIL